MDHLCYLYIVSVMLSRLLIAALWSPSRKGLTSCLSFVMFNCAYVIIPCGILGQVWYLIVSIPDICHLFHFHITVYNQGLSNILSTMKRLIKINRHGG